MNVALYVLFAVATVSAVKAILEKNNAIARRNYFRVAWILAGSGLLVFGFSVWSRSN